MQPENRIPASDTTTQQLTAAAAPAPVSYTFTFEATMAAIREEQGAPKIEQTVVFISWQTPTESVNDLASSPTLVSNSDDITQLTPLPNPTPAPISPYLQPVELSRPDPHTNPTLIPPDYHLIHPQ